MIRKTVCIRSVPPVHATVPLSRTCAQNKRKIHPFWTEIDGCRVSKDSRINVNFLKVWSGRWESNPRPKLGKLLYCHCTTPARRSLFYYELTSEQCSSKKLD